MSGNFYLKQYCYTMNQCTALAVGGVDCDRLSSTAKPYCSCACAACAAPKLLALVPDEERRSKRLRSSSNPWWAAKNFKKMHANVKILLDHRRKV